MTDTPPLPLRILLGLAAALWAVLVPGQATLLTERPVQWPRRRRLRVGSALRQPEMLAVRLPAES